MKNIIVNLIIGMSFIFQLTGQVNQQNSKPPCPFDAQVSIHDNIVKVQPTTDRSIIQPVSGDYYLRTDNEDSRFIFWVHGLGGEGSSWEPAKNNVDYGTADGTFPARKTSGTSETYTNGGVSMNDCSFNVNSTIKDKQDIKNATLDQKMNTMVIAHSQGGIVARNMIKLMENDPLEHRVGGIVTFCTSHDGAQILNNAKNGNSTYFAQWACNLLLDGPIRERISNLPGLVKLFLNENDLTTQIKEVLCDKLTTTLAEKMINKWAGEAQTDFYKVGSPDLKELKEYELKSENTYNPYRVAFYSEETDEGDLIWRTLNYVMNLPTDKNNFGANQDVGEGTLKEIIDNLRTWYQDNANSDANAAYSKCMKEKLGWPYSLRHILCVDVYNSTIDKNRAFARAEQFFLSANERWKWLIGANFYEGCVVRGSQEDVDQLGNPNTTDFELIYPEINDLNACDDKAAEVAQWPYILNAEGSISAELKTQPSDGIVTVQSAQAMPAQTFPTQKLVGSSHMQVRNDKNTKWSLLNMFEGTLPLNDDDPQVFFDCKNWMITRTKY